MIFRRLDDLLEVIVQLVHIDNHILVQHRRSDILHLFADQTEVLQVGFDAKLVTVSDGKFWQPHSACRMFANLRIRQSAAEAPLAE